MLRQCGLRALALTVASLIPGAATLVNGSDPISWPAVKPITREYDFRDASHANVDLTLDGVQGKQLYTFHCRPGLSEGIGGEEADFDGDFSCHLHSLYTQDRYESLLIDNPLDILEAHSRGEFWAEQLVGKCGDYPEYGRMRSFKLRGMVVSLELTGIHPIDGNPKKLSSFHFRIDVSQEAGNLSSIAEPPGFLPPWKSKSTVGHPTRCGDPVPQHIPGEVTTEYVENAKLGPPFALIPKTTVKVVVDAKSGVVGPGYWVPIAPLKRGAGFVHATINDKDGIVAYQLDCDADTIWDGVAIAGDGLRCGLFAADNDTNLLIDSVDPFTRMSPSLILPRQLYGREATYDDWGTTRHFGLRGMSLTLKFEKPAFAMDDLGNPALIRSDLVLLVEPDPAATAPVAQPPKTSYKDFLPHFLTSEAE